jgi:hypothetical protein
MAFVYGNHDCRGSWMPHLDDVLLPRSATERTAAFAELNWNFAERLGDMALVGMDTGEDKPDAHPKWFGLANFEPYRRLQARWLEETLARPDIASAPFKVVFCHIPLYAAPDHPDHAHDGAAIDPHDWAFWSRECFDLWNPILEKGVSSSWWRATGTATATTCRRPAARGTRFSAAGTSWAFRRAASPTRAVSRPSSKARSGTDGSS